MTARFDKKSSASKSSGVSSRGTISPVAVAVTYWTAPSPGLFPASAVSVQVLSLSPGA